MKTGSLLPALAAVTQPLGRARVPALEKGVKAEGGVWAVDVKVTVGEGPPVGRGGHSRLSSVP